MSNRRIFFIFWDALDKRKTSCFFVFDDLWTGLVDPNVRLNRIHERAQSSSYGMNQIRTLYRF